VSDCGKKISKLSFNIEFCYKFDLVCDRSNIASLTKSVHMLRYFISGLVFAYYSGKYGRRPLVWISFTLEILSIISCSLSVNIIQYITSRLPESVVLVDLKVFMLCVGFIIKNIWINSLSLNRSHNNIMQALNVRDLNIVQKLLYFLVLVGF
jgi:MFS family permease